MVRIEQSEFSFTKKYQFFLFSKADGSAISQKLLAYSDLNSSQKSICLHLVSREMQLQKVLTPLWIVQLDSQTDQYYHLPILCTREGFFFHLKSLSSHLIYKKGDIHCPWSSSVDISGSLPVHTIITKILLDFY